MMTASVVKAVEFILSAGQVHDAPLGRLLIETAGKQKLSFPC